MIDERATKQLWKHVTAGDPNECWVWERRVPSSEYAIIKVEGKSFALAHRYSYELHYGPIPKGVLVRHTCDNPPCCNPNHLILGNHHDNALDREKRNRGGTKRTAIGRAVEAVRYHQAMKEDDERWKREMALVNEKPKPCPYGSRKEQEREPQSR